MQHMKQNTTLNQSAAAKFVGVSPDTLRRWRKAGTGPAYIEVHNDRVRYSVESLETWTKEWVKPSAA